MTDCFEKVFSLAPKCNLGTKNVSGHLSGKNIVGWAFDGHIFQGDFSKWEENSLICRFEKKRIEDNPI